MPESMQRYEDIPAINWSTLKHIDVSPLMYDWRRTHPREDTASLLLGRADHCAVFEPDEFSTRYVVGEARQCTATTKKGTPCTNAALPLAEHCGVHGGQGEAEAWRAENPDVEVITAEQEQVIGRCAEAIRRHPDASALLSGAHTEQVITWIDAETGLRCKARLDTFDRRRVVDLKTTSRGLARFHHDAAAYLYHGQMAWYRAGGIAAGVLDEDARAYIVTSETDEPFDCGAYEVRGLELEAGNALWRRLLDELASCLATGNWYGRCPTLTRLELPRWALDHAEGDL